MSEDIDEGYMNLLAAIFAKPEPPCDECKYSKRCESELLACDAYHMYTLADEGKKGTNHEQIPSEECYKAIFPDQG